MTWKTDTTKMLTVMCTAAIVPISIVIIDIITVILLQQSHSLLITVIIMTDNIRPCGSPATPWSLSSLSTVSRLLLRIPWPISRLSHHCTQNNISMSTEYNREWYNWHSAGSLGWPFPMLKYKYIFFQLKYTEAILSNSTRRLLWFEISKMPTAVLKK